MNVLKEFLDSRPKSGKRVLGRRLIESKLCKLKRKEVNW